jgi:dolichyl-phosphate beta-glucosyltransferase
MPLKTDSKEGKIKLSIIVSFFNEGSRLGKTLEQIKEYTAKTAFDCQVILSDDKSTDNSIAIAKKYADEIDHFSYLEPQKHHGKGKGAGIQRGIDAADGEIIMFMDADSSTPVSEAEKLLPYIKDYDIVMGSRYIKEPRPYKPNYLWGICHGIKSIFEVIIYGHSKDYQAKGKQGRLRQLISRGGNFVFTLFLNQSYADQRCGFKMYRRNSAKLLAGLQTLPGFGFDTEYLTIAQKYRLRIIEVPVEWFDEAGSTYGMKDAIKEFKDMFKVLFNRLTGKYSKRNAQKNLGEYYKEYVLND